MESRRRASQRLFDVDQTLIQPGEYGIGNHPDGWVVLVVAGQTIYLASEKYAEKLAAHYKIPAKQIVSLNHAYGSQKAGLPEILLPGSDGFDLFHERLDKINRRQNTVIIHCKHGMNRTPVAAVLYLIKNKIDPARAVALVTEAYQQQRNKQFVLNSRGNYSLVLEHAGIPLEPRTRRHTK